MTVLLPIKKLVLCLYVFILLLLFPVYAEGTSKYQSKPYNFEMALAIGQNQMHIRFMCGIRYFEEYATLQISTPPIMTINDLAEDNQTLEINSFLCTFDKQELMIPYINVNNENEMTLIVDKNQPFFSKLEGMNRIQNAEIKQMLSTLITFILVFSIYDVLLPDFQNNQITINDGQIDRTVNGMFLMTRLKSGYIEYRESSISGITCKLFL